MDVSKNGIHLIKSFEGLRLTPYIDASGIWTVGFGHALFRHEIDHKITETEAEDLLHQDLQKFVRELNGEGLTLNQNQFDALISFIFNVGIGTWRNSTLRRDIVGRVSGPEIRKQFMRWVHGRYGNELPGLVTRRAAEAKLYQTPV